MPRCPQCGELLPPDAPDGLCPKCVMAMNLKTETAFSGDMPAAQPPLPPEQIAPHFPQLEILECLGRGGMGVVYKARQKSLNRFVALKLLAPERVRDAKFAERFAREAQALAALSHPNIVTIYDFGQAGGFYYLLMEFVDGVNLRQLLRARKFMPEEALAIVPPLCDALQFAHDRGIVHRDIKPENLLLDKTGKVKVADFGIAKMLGEPLTPALSPSDGARVGTPGEGLSLTGEQTLGTPSYSAPEQKSDPQRVDSRADIYSLGVVFYEMLTGELPGKKIEPPSKKVQIDVRLDEIVLRALEKKPELRYQQVSEVKTMVETIAATPPGSSRGNEARTEKAESGKRKAEIAPRFSRTAIGGFCFVLLAVGLFGSATAINLIAPTPRLPTGEILRNTPAELVSAVLLVASVLCFLIFTSYGWIAVTRIRRSAGQIYGLWLAVFDGLLFPLLALDAVIVGLNVELVLYSFSRLDVPASRFLFILGLLPAAGVVPVLDFFISRHVWLMVNKPLDGAANGKTEVKPASGTALGIAGGILAVAILMAALLGTWLCERQKQASLAREQASLLRQATIRQQQERADEYLARVRTLTAFPGDTDTNIIPLIQMQDVPLLITIEHLARQMQMNYAMEPTLAAELENAPTVTIRWENLTAGQALTALLDSRDLQLIENPQTGVARIVKKTADISPQPANASAETWSPELAPGEKPDFQKILESARALMDEGSYEESLQHYLWYFDHSRNDTGQRGVRLSFALSYWTELGRRYPKAKQALVEIRDADVRQLSDGGYSDLFQEVAGINQYLGDDAATLVLFQKIEQRDPELARQCFLFVENLLAQNGNYQTCRKYLGDPQAAFDWIRQSWQRMKQFEEQQAARGEAQRKSFEAMAKTNSIFAHLPSLATPPPFADENFVKQTRQLIEILVATGGADDAEKIQREAVALLDDPRLKSAVSDAEEKTRQKRAQNSEAQAPKPATVTGEVTDQNGKPLAHALWRISAVEEWRDGQWELIHYLGDTQWSATDAEGRFTLTFHGRQRFDLQFAGFGEFAPGFVYEVSPDAHDLKIVMKPGIPVRGTVVASNSNRFSGYVRVELRLPSRDLWYQEENITDADGHFMFYVCPAPTEPNKAIPSKWQISCAGLVTPFDAEGKSISMNLQVDARAEIVVNTNTPASSRTGK
jgi:predicted Ser/Thr protein kinase